MGALAGREQGKAAIHHIDIELARIEASSEPFEQFRMTLVLWIRDGFQELAIAPWAADILGRAAPGAVDEARIGDALDCRSVGFQHHDAAQLSPAPSRTRRRKTTRLEQPKLCQRPALGGTIKLGSRHGP